MNIRYMIPCFVALIACAGIFSKGHTQSVRTVTTAVPFLRISPDARAGGMGDAGIATAPDVNSGFYNLAKTPFAQVRSAVGASYSPWLKEINGEMYFATLAGFHQLDGGQALSASVRYFNLGNIELADYNGNLLQTSQPREFAADLGYSRKLSEKIGLGLAIRYINSNLMSGSVNGIQYKTGSALAADISVYYNGLNEKGQGWTLGAVATNLGSKISYSDNQLNKEYLPARLGLGAANTNVFDEDNKLTLAFEVNKALVPGIPTDSASMVKYYNYGMLESMKESFSHSSFQYSVGAEYVYKDQFSLRAGYYAETKDEGDRKYFTAGAGINYNAIGLNFSYLVPFNSDMRRHPLSSTIRVGVVFNIESKSK